MNQIATVIRYELRRGLRDRGLAALLILFVGLCGFAAWNGAEWAEGRTAAAGLVAAEVDTAMERKRKDMAEAPAGKPPFSAMPETMPFRPVLLPGPLAALSIGQADAYPFAARFQPLSDSTIFNGFTVDIDNPAVRAAGRFDLAFVIVFLLPLLILANTFDLWSREREGGIAAMILSQPIGPGRLMFGKALARGLLLLPAAVLAATGALILGRAGAGAVDVAGLVSTALTIGVYGVFWIGVAALVNVFVRRSTETAVACGVAWISIVVLAPALALSLADAIAPAPSTTQYALALRAESTAIRTRQRLLREASQPDAASPPTTRIPPRMREFYLERTEEDRLLAPRISAHRAAQDRRRQTLDALRMVLPAVAVQDALDRIAGADADRAVAFQDEVLAFKGRTRTWLAGRLEADQPLSAHELGALPRFALRPVPGGPFQHGVLIDLAVLLGSAGLVFGGVLLGRRASTTL
jgi:ABC-2 type transport system permease protein